MNECLCGHRYFMHDGKTLECLSLVAGQPCRCAGYAEVVNPLPLSRTVSREVYEAEGFRFPDPGTPLPPSEICDGCSHPRTSHTPGKTPPCEKGDGRPCFCLKFKKCPGCAKGLQDPNAHVGCAKGHADRPAHVREDKASNPKEAFGSSKIPHLFPSTAIAAGSMAFLYGALKYGKHNWRHVGVRASTYFDALQRHVLAWWEGEESDPDSGLPHLAHALACLAVLVDAKAADKFNDDRPISGGYGKLTAQLTNLVASLKRDAAAKGLDPKHWTRGSAAGSPPGVNEP